MKYLNLTEGFNPFGSEDWQCIKHESFFFNGGEPHIKLKVGKDRIDEDIQITSRLSSTNDFMMLCVALDALKQSSIVGEVYLFIPYFPGSRQDRRMVHGEPLTCRVYADILNELNIDYIQTFDNHSDVTTALLDNCEDMNNHGFVRICIEDLTPHDKPLKENIVISPDAGSNKKIYSLVQSLWGNAVVKCDKTRDVTNGKISGFEVYVDDLNGRNCVIVDDICDGGGTFIGLAQELKRKNCGDLYLIVSHGIFSKGLSDLYKYFKCIYTTDSFIDIKATEQFKQIKFNEFLS